MLVVRINGRQVSYSGLSCSSSRRGGFESCSFTIPRGASVRKGDDVRVWDGLFTVWHGFVNSPGIRQSGSVRSASVTAVGYGAKLKLRPYSMIYIDRRLSEWRGLSDARVLEHLAGSLDGNGPEIRAEGANDPKLYVGFPGAWSRARQCEAWYDAGPSCSISKVRGSWTRLSTTGTAAPWSWAMMLTTVDGAITANNNSGNLVASGPGTSEAVATGDRRYALLYTAYSGFPAGSDAVVYGIEWSDVQVHGDHGLAATTDDNDLAAYYATDVIEDALRRSGAGFDARNLGGVGGDFAVSQLASKTPITPEDWIEQMITLLGWNYGTWEPDAFSDRPTFMYGAPPVEATAVVQYADCSDDTIDDVLTDQYTHALAVYTNAYGSERSVEVSKANPAVPGWWANTLFLNFGMTMNPSTRASFLLALSQDNGRAAGSIRLPYLLAGGKPAHHLRPGRDRLRINNLPNVADLLSDSGAVRGDEFSLDRMTVSQDTGGAVLTVVEVDSGADLVETLAARIDLSHELAAVGG